MNEEIEKLALELADALGCDEIFSRGDDGRNHQGAARIVNAILEAEYDMVVMWIQNLNLGGHPEAQQIDKAISVIAPMPEMGALAAGEDYDAAKAAGVSPLSTTAGANANEAGVTAGLLRRVELARRMYHQALDNDSRTAGERIGV